MTSRGMTPVRTPSASRGDRSNPVAPTCDEIILLAAVLETAVERELIGRNPAKGRNRRVRERAPRRTQLDSAAAIGALLDAAGSLDAASREENRHVHRRGIVTVLVFAGLRISELCDLRWRDVDLAGGWLTVRDSKTDAGRRRVRIRGVVRDELLRIKSVDVNPNGFVFSTRPGGRSNPNNVRNRILRPATELATARIVDRDGQPLPHLTPHSLRRTFASVLYALGETPATVMSEMGHTNPAMALRVYAQAMRRDEGENVQLVALVEGGQSAVIGSRDAATADALLQGDAA